MAVETANGDIAFLRHRHPDYRDFLEWSLPPGRKEVSSRAIGRESRRRPGGFNSEYRLSNGAFEDGNSTPSWIRESIDFSAFEEQPGDDAPTLFSFRSSGVTLPQVPCWISFTTRAGSHRHPRESGPESSVWRGHSRRRVLRYCPVDRGQESSSFQIGIAIRSSWNPKGWTPT